MMEEDGEDTDSLKNEGLERRWTVTGQLVKRKKVNIETKMPDSERKGKNGENTGAADCIEAQVGS